MLDLYLFECLKNKSKNKGINCKAAVPANLAANCRYGQTLSFPSASVNHIKAKISEGLCSAPFSNMLKTFSFCLLIFAATEFLA